MIPVATATLRDSTLAAMGSETVRCAFARIVEDKPDPSFPTAIAIRYRRQSSGDLLIVAQLEANESILELENEHLRAPKGRRWEFVISTNEPAYGGRAAARLQSHAKEVVLTEPELIVFCEKDGQDP